MPEIRKVSQGMLIGHITDIVVIFDRSMALFMKKYVLPFLCLFFPFLSHGQNFAWASLIASGGNDLGMSIGHDDSGNVYSAGYFSTTADFNPGAGVYNLTSATGSAAFILKQSPSGSFVWAKCITRAATSSIAASASAYTMAVDGMGNVYVAGGFSGNVDFDPGTGSSTTTAVGSSDAFLLKLDRNGAYMYHRVFGGSALESISQVTLDRNNNILLTGKFASTTDFDPGTGVVNLTSAGGDDIFVEKLNNAGNFVWVKQMGGTSLDNGYALCTDNAGNIYSTGIFCGTADFDPGSGTFNLYTSPSFRDCFVSKLDSNGNFVWAVQMGSYVHEDIGYAIAVDAARNVYLAGSWEGSADFDPDASGTFTLTSNGGSFDMFVEKLNPSGNFVWAKQIGGTGSDGAYAMVLDTFTHVYITGSFTGTADFDPNSGTSNLTSASATQYDAFVLKMDTAGNYVWAGAIGGRGSDVGHGICLDGPGSIYTTGSCQDTVDFDPSVAVYNLPGYAGTDIYTHKLNQCLPVTPAITITSNPGDTLTLSTSDTFTATITNGGAAPVFQWYINGVAVAGATNATYICDTLKHHDVITCQLTSSDSCAVTDTVTSAAHTIIILDVAVQQITSVYGLIVYPNPSEGIIYVQANGLRGEAARLVLMDITGRILCSETLQNGLTLAKLVIPNSVPNGVYLVQITGSQGKEIARISLER